MGAVLLAVCLGSCGLLRAATPLHEEVLVFVPAYEGSQLWDPNLQADGPTCVWGNIDTLLSSQRYFALRLPNLLEARTMRAAGPIQVYGTFLSALTKRDDDAPGFSPYTLGADFFIFNYDWRQDIGSVSAPQLGRALEGYARDHERATGIPAAQTRFVIVTHSMGGLVARTLLGEEPAWAPRISRLYLVGSPNAGSVKAVKTVVYGPDSIRAYASGFPGMLLNLLPTDVDQNVTKLTGITRPSLYELLPTGDPAWTERLPDGRVRRMGKNSVFRAESWERYWPTAGLERRLFIDGWLRQREAEGRKRIEPAAWEFCQDESYGPLKKIMAEVNAWRAAMGTLDGTSKLLAAPGGTTRLRLIAGTGLKTASGVVTEGEHDSGSGYYTYEAGDGDGTVELRRCLEDVPASATNVKLLHGVPHGSLMTSGQFLDYFRGELAGERVVGEKRP